MERSSSADFRENFYTRCHLCGRECGADRTRGEAGFCGEGADLRIAWAGLHYGEEPVICGAGGSGAVFLSGCTLRCFFCQNYELSGGGGLGRDVSLYEFTEICLMLQEKGAENINIVTGTHFIPSLAAGISAARERGLRLPVVWNSSGFEREALLEVLDSFTDIYLPDIKTLDSRLGRALFGVSGYAQAAARAVLAMAASRPLRYADDSSGRLVSGLIVRHLVLPGLMENTREVLTWFAENLAGRALLSLMFQFTPLRRPLPRGEGADSRHKIPGDWDRRVSSREYAEVLSFLEELGIEEGFVQELPDTDELPDFSRADAFPPALARPLWFYGGPENA